MNTKKAVVRGRRREDGFGLAEGSIDLFKTHHESRDGAWTHGDVAPNFYIPFPPTSRLDASFLARLRIFTPEKRIGEFLIELLMNFPDSIGGRRTPVDPSTIDPRLHGDVRTCLELEITLSRL